MGSRAVDGVIPAGDVAPAFTLPVMDPGRGTSGGQASVPDPAARGLQLAVFFKNTCPTCRLALTFIQRIHEHVAESGGLVSGISQDGMDGAASFARELSLTFPILVDGADYPVSRQYDLVSVPTLYLIDRDGTIRRSGTGFHKQGLMLMTEDLAGSVSAGPVALYRDGDSVPDFKPG